MNKNKWGEILFIALVLSGFFFFKNIFSSKSSALSYVVAGTGNPGEILIYEQKDKEIKKIKTLDTGYKFVYTVRIGDIFNNGKQNVIAGVSNSFFKEPYGCKVLSYDLKDFKEKIIDDVGDLRCMDLFIGDADNDGKNEVILGTHGTGFVKMYKWSGSQWNTEIIDSNFIDEIDKEEGTNHRIPNNELSCGDCINQTAIHGVKIADVDNDGKNEVIATISTPLESLGRDEISFVKIYKKTNKGWDDLIIDRINDKEFRSIAVGDIYHKNKQILLIGVGSPAGQKGLLFSYELVNGEWKRDLIYSDENKNIKALAVGDIYGKKKQQIFLATGFPKANVVVLDWNGMMFNQRLIGEISSFIKEKNGEFNSVSAIIHERRYKGKNATLIIAGMIVFAEQRQGWMDDFPRQKIRWEGTEKGFIVQFTQKDENTWIPTIIESRNVLGMD